MPQDRYEINREIHKREEDPTEDRVIDIYEDEAVKIYYVKKSEKDPDRGYWLQKDALKAELKGEGATVSHEPRLDPYVSVEDNILCMTSDGECWVCDLKTGRENTIGMPIVAFYHRVSFDMEGRHRDVPNAFLVYGTGCFWGLEAYEQEFEIYVDKDTLEAKYQDVWDEEEGYEEYIEELDSEE